MLPYAETENNSCNLFFHLRIEDETGQIAEDKSSADTCGTCSKTAFEEPDKSFFVHCFPYTFP
jgi:hypothetical protein